MSRTERRLAVLCAVLAIGLGAWSVAASFTIRAQRAELEELRARECDPFLTVAR